MADTKKPIERRDFFGALLAKIVEPIAGVVEKKIDKIEQAVAAAMKDAPPLSPAGPPPMRPPGTLSEAHLLKMCERSGHCIAACPVQAIRPLSDPNPRLHNTPHIVPDVQACVLCEDLPCITACPSGALMPTTRENVRIGLASVHYDLCLRADGEECRECLDACPLGEKAIRLDEHEAVEVVAEGCTGCGVCIPACPAPLRAVTVIPRMS